jgi:hypothetical protein
VAITDYTSCNDIRAVLGVTSDELDDTTISLDVYRFNLDSEFEDIHLSLKSSFATVKAVAELTRSETEERLYRTVNMFATYAVARQLLGALPLFSPKEITDGKAGMSRYASDPYKETMKRVEKQYETARARCSKALEGYLTTFSSNRVSRPYMGVVSPATDVVTNV